MPESNAPVTPVATPVGELAIPAPSVDSGIVSPESILDTIAQVDEPVATLTASADAPVVEDPTIATQSPADDLTTLRAQVQALQELLFSSTPQTPAPQDLSTPAPVPVQTQTQPPVSSSEEVDFLADDEALLNSMRSREGMNKVLNAVRARAKEDVLRTIPQLVAVAAREEASRQIIASEFYRSNPDLIAHKDKVALVAQGLQARNPQQTFEQLLANVAKTVRPLLGLQAAPTQTIPTAGVATPAKRPVAAPATGARPAQPAALNKQQQIIASLLS